MLDGMLEDHWNWLEAKRLASEKVRHGEIAERLGVNFYTMRSWLNGKRPFSIKPGLDEKIYSPVPFTPEMAFLTAAYTSKHLYSSRSNLMITREQHPQLYYETRAALAKLGFKVTEHFNERKGFSRLEVVNPTRLKDALEKYSTRQKGVPLHLLDEEQKIRAYLRALTMSNGVVNIETLAKRKHLSFSLLMPFKSVALLFAKIGLFPTISSAKKAVRLNFTRSELGPLELKGLLGTEHAEKIRKLRPTVSEDNTHQDIDKVEQVLSLKAQLRDPAEIERDTGVNKNTVTGWNKRSAPRSAQRLAAAFNLSEKLGHPLGVDHFLKWPLTLQMGLNSLEAKRKKARKGE
ncbi:TPA: hypothetical protein HA244_02370 [Candidatus Micrarchaeota archaeon]|nr:hypothetical protein [Candidatus Micrarchaeota archaeon]